MVPEQFDFEKAWLRLLPQVAGKAWREFKSDVDAQEVIARVAARAWRKRESLRDTRAFGAWIFVTLDNEILRFRKEQSRQGKRAGELPVDQPAPPVVEPLTFFQGLLDAVDAAQLFGEGERLAVIKRARGEAKEKADDMRYSRALKSIAMYLLIFHEDLLGSESRIRSQIKAAVMEGALERQTARRLLEVIVTRDVKGATGTIKHAARVVAIRCRISLADLEQRFGKPVDEEFA